MSFIFSVDLLPHLFNTSQLAIYIEHAKFVPSSYQLSEAQKEKDSAVKAYEDFIKQTVILFSEEEDINVTTKIAQDIFDFEVNLTKKIYDFGFDLPEFPDYNYTYDYPDDYGEESSSTAEPELLQARSDESTSPPQKESEPSTKLKDIDRKLESEGWLQLVTDIFQDASVTLTGEEEVNTFNERFLKGAMKLLNETSGVIVNNYFGWKLLSKLGPIASHNMTTLNLEFNKVWRGLQGPEPRWRHCVSAVNDPYDPIIGNGMGKLYVDKYFNSTQKQDESNIEASTAGQVGSAEEHQARIHLTNTLKALLEEEESSPGTFSEDIKLCKEHLLAMLEERYKGAQVRSRVETLKGETQLSKIFRTHERQRATENRNKELRQGARVFTSREDIAGVFKASFGELLREERFDDVVFEPFLRGSPSVPEGAMDIFNCPIREAEILHAIKHLPRNKAPGPDGIGSEFYKIFSDALCPILARVFNGIRRRKLLPPTMRQSFMVLVPKKSKKDHIFEAEILARRLDTGLKSISIIGTHQTYGLRGRRISRNLHIMRAIGEGTAEGHQPLAVLQLDLRQAFDRVSHRFLLAAVDRFSVGEELRE
ncbi:phosphate-regulating neutral endopeptidase PHEX [Ixodes scapularis]